MFIDYMKENKLDRLALVGTNSQGKSYLIMTMMKQTSIAKKTILVANEVKADENLKNSTENSTLIAWLNSLMDNSKIKDEINNEINKVDLSKINENSFLNLSLKNNMESYKGIISAEISTNSNQWKKPGSGEKFLGQLLLISKILEENKDETYEYLIIDEPEQHLHPSFYIKVANILNKISHQGIKVIIATHSPIITQYFIEDTNELVKVVNGECNYLPEITFLMEESLKFNCYEEEKLGMVDFKRIKDKYNLYFKNFVLPIIIKSLFCQYMLVGEGAVERKVFELYLLKYGSSLNKNNIDYCIVDGKIFFPCILYVLKKLGIITITIYDLDAENNEIHKNLNSIINLLSDYTIPMKPNIELFFEITPEIKKQENYDKYRGAILLINEYFINENSKLLNLFSMINLIVEKLQEQ